jgi:hypothetical protein
VSTEAVSLSGEKVTASEPARPLGRILIGSLRAIRHAVRDVFLIVVGVLLALAADSWRERGQERQAEAVMLGAMHSALVADLSALELAVAGYEAAEAANLFLQRQLASSEPYADSLDALFGMVYSTGVVQPPNMAPYEALKARGLQLISDEALRLQIIEVYENTYATIHRQNDFNVNVVFEVLRPYYLSHFRDLRFGQSATPLDYAALKQDQYFHNMLVYRADFVRRALIDQYANAITSIKALLDALDVQVVGS